MKKTAKKTIKKAPIIKGKPQIPMSAPMQPPMKCGGKVKKGK